MEKKRMSFYPPKFEAGNQPANQKALSIRCWKGFDGERKKKKKKKSQQVNDRIDEERKGDSLCEIGWIGYF